MWNVITIQQLHLQIPHWQIVAKFEDVLSLIEWDRPSTIGIIQQVYGGQRILGNQWAKLRIGQHFWTAVYTWKSQQNHPYLILICGLWDVKCEYLVEHWQFFFHNNKLYEARSRDSGIMNKYESASRVSCLAKLIWQEKNSMRHNQESSKYDENIKSTV